MKITAVLIVGAAAAAVAGASYAAGDNGDNQAFNAGGCKIVQLKPGESPPTGLSTSVTAGNGQVSAQSTVGNGVTVHSGNGAVAGSVATSTTDGRTTVTTSDGNCTTYIKPKGD